MLILKHSWVLVIFPKSGLGNKFLSWARAVVFSDAKNIPIRFGRFSEVKIGPYLRYERTKRFYFGMINSNFNPILSFLAFMGYRVVSNPTCIQSKNDPAIYIFDEPTQFPDYFSCLQSKRNLIIKEFYRLIKKDIVEHAFSLEPPIIAIHIRLGDFRSSTFFSNQTIECNTRTPLEYFINIIQELRSIYKQNLPVTIFTDGYVDEVSEILKINNVALFQSGSDIIDLLLLSRAKIIVPSPGSTFSGWAAFISSAIIITHPLFMGEVRGSRAQMYEGTVENLKKILSESLGQQ